MTASPVDEELAAAFARDGVACVRGVLDPAELASAARAIEIVLANPSPIAQVASAAEDPGSFFEDFCRWREIPEIEQLARHSRVPQAAAALMSTPQVRFYHDHVLVKDGGTRQRTPWHQDQPYYNVDGQGVSAWIPVDPVPADGCLELVASSHLGPWLMPRTFLAGEARWFPEGSLAELPDIDADPGAFDIRRFELRPGDAIFSTSLPCTARPASRIWAGGGCCRCAICPLRPGMRRGPGGRHRLSTGSRKNCPPDRRWTIRCSPSSGPPHPDLATERRRSGCRADPAAGQIRPPG